MSYYNYVFKAIKLEPEMLRDNQYSERHLVFTEVDKGFEELLEMVNPSAVSEFPSSAKAVVFEEIGDLGCMLRGNSLIMGEIGKVFIGDANCTVKVEDLDHKVDWSSDNYTIDELEDAVKYAKTFLKGNEKDTVFIYKC